MIKSLIISLILTIFIELFISIFIGIRKKNDIITIIAVNTLTNPIVVFIANILNTFEIVLLYWTIVIIMEFIVVFIEGKIYEKILNFRKKSGFKLSFINNIISFSIGLIITILLNINTNLSVEAASTFYPLTQEILSSQDIKYNLKMKSTNEVYEDIIKGRTDIIIATEPSFEQTEKIKNSNVELEFKTIYLEPLVILLNKSNSIDNLSIQQIKEIYYGNNLNWNTYQLEKNNGSQTCFENIVKNNNLGENHYEFNTMPKIIDKIGLDKKGIGYTFYSYYSKMHINNDTKIISINNKEINKKDYPLLFKVYLIYRVDNRNENISEIIKWIDTEECKNLITTSISPKINKK